MKLTKEQLIQTLTKRLDFARSIGNHEDVNALFEVLSAIEHDKDDQVYTENNFISLWEDALTHCAENAYTDCRRPNIF